MHRLFIVPTLAAALCAGEPATAPAPVQLSVADGATLAAHWDASLYAKVWNDPGLAWVRGQWAEAKAELAKAKGIDLDALLAALKDLRGEFLGLDASGKPSLRLQADLGTQAAPLFALLATEGAPAQVPGADAALSLRDGPVIARFGTRLVLAMGCEVASWPVEPATADGRMVIDYKRFLALMTAVMPAPQRAEMERMQRDMAPWLGTLDWQSRLVPQGMHEVIDYDVATPGMLPLDRAVLDRFPANALLAGAAGVDLAAVWQVAGPYYLDTIDALLHRGVKRGPEATTAELDALLQGLGVAGGLAQLVKEVKGTVALAVTPGVPFPAGAVVVPRSPAIDALVAVGLAQFGVLPPAEGASTILPIPDVPVVISLACDRGHWLLTSDSMLVDAWLSGKPGGFLASPAGQATFAGAPADAYLAGGLDTAAVLRLALPFAAMGLSQARDLPPEAVQAILAGLNRLAREAGPSSLWSGMVEGKLRTEAKGPLGLGFVPAIIAAIAIPNLIESRVTAYEAATAATLKSGIFPAQIQFQGGGYMDQDEDNVGEYGTLAELSGRQKTSRTEAGALRLLVGQLAQGNTANGYNFRIYLPDGKGGGFSSDDAPRTPNAKLADDHERFWIAYAWPMSRENGRIMFALGADGQLRSLPWDGQEPAWNAALGQGWEGMPTWPIYERNRPQRRQRQRPQAMPMPAPAPVAPPSF